MGLIFSTTLLPAMAMAEEPGVGPEDLPAPAGIIVQYEEGTSPAEQSEVLREEGLYKESDLGLIGADVAAVEEGSVAEAIETVEANPDVLYAEPDRIVRPMDASDEPRFDELWGMHNTGQPIKGKPGRENVDINALEASRVTQGSESVVVAVIDDGVDVDHPDLRDRAWTNPEEAAGETGQDDDNNGYIDDVNGWNFEADNNQVHAPGWDFHGTHVAGTIAASDNDVGVVGVAPNVEIMPVKWLGPFGGRLSDAIRAIEYAKKGGAKISNNSWGYAGKPSASLKEAIKKSGMLFVAAAGNGGRDGKGDDNDAGTSQTSYPASYDLPNVLSVAAASNAGKLAGFSNYGARTVDISAPGVNVLSDVPHTPEEPGLVLSSVAGGGVALTSGFGIEKVPADAQASFVEKALGAVGGTNEEVVVIDDDQSATQEGLIDATPSIVGAVEAATDVKPPVTEVATPEADGPDLSGFQGRTVVWSTGQHQASFADDPYFFGTNYNLTRADRQNLTTFLKGGGRLILSGNWSTWGVEESGFLLDTLQIDSRSEYTTSQFEGAPGTAFEGEFYALQQKIDPYGSLNTVLRPAGLAAQSQGVISSDPYEYLSGTSMSAPHATGTAALVASQSPGLLSRPVALKKAILESGKPLPATRGKTVTGKMVNASGAVNGAGR